MQIILTTDTATFSMDAGEKLDLESLKIFCEVETGIPASEMLFHLNGQVPLVDAKKSLKDHGVRAGDIIVITRVGNQLAHDGGGDAHTTSPVTKESGEEQDESNPEVLSPEEQAREAKIDANYEEAMECLPESFWQVVMLFIDIKLNGHPVKALVDTGAKFTIMSRDLAERCNLTDLIDTRVEGMVHGVAGTQKILGRVRWAQIQVGNIFLNSSFVVLEKENLDFIIGLDMLRFHQCVIDLERNVLVIGTTKTEARLLPEAETPKLKFSFSEDPSDPGQDENSLSLRPKPEEQARQAKIDANYEEAMEHLPESFGRVSMPFIDIKLNGHPVKAFVDSGAQATVLSRDLAERCNLMDLIDTMYTGIAHGIGIQQLLGRVHLAQLQVGDVFLNSSFFVLEKLEIGLVIGLDILRCHQCVIDLERNVLVIGSTKTEARFLPEAEIPKIVFASSEDPDTAQEDDKSGTLSPEDFTETSRQGKKRAASPFTQNSGDNKKAKKA